MRAPTLRRKLALTAKVQDEVGHAQLLYRVAEDLGKPREAMLEDLLAGKTKFHNVFHYPTKSWGDIGIIAWLVDAAAIVAQQALRDSSYAPVRADDAEDLLGGVGPHHARPGRRGDADDRHADQRAMVQEALDRWWGPLMQMHGPRGDRAKDRDLHWRIKAKTSEELRQEFLTIYVPRIWELGLTIPDPDLRLDERPRSGATPSPTGPSCARSSPATARSRRSGSSSAGSTARTRRWVRETVLGDRPRRRR